MAAIYERKPVVAFIILIMLCVFSTGALAGEIKVVVKGEKVKDLKVEMDFSQVDRSKPEEVAATFFNLQISMQNCTETLKKIISESYIEEISELLEIESIVDLKKGLVPEREKRFPQLKKIEHKVIKSEAKANEVVLIIAIKPVFDENENAPDFGDNDEGNKLTFNLVKEDNAWHIKDITSKCYACNSTGVCPRCDEGRRRFDEKRPDFDKDGDKDDAEQPDDRCEDCKGTKKCRFCNGTGSTSLFNNALGIPIDKDENVVIDRSSPKKAVESVMALNKKYKNLMRKIFMESILLKYAETIFSKELCEKVKKPQTEKDRMYTDQEPEKITVSDDQLSVKVYMKNRYLSKDEDDDDRQFNIHNYNMRKDDGGKWKIINRTAKCNECGENGRCPMCDGERDPADGVCDHCKGTGNCPACNSTRIKKMPFSLEFFW